MAADASIPDAPFRSALGRRRAAAGVLVLVLLAFALYQPALSGGWLWDDKAAVSENPLLDGAAGLRAIWFAPSRLPNEAHYWPLTYTSFWLERRVWGDAARFGHHVGNVALHALNGVLLWLALRRLRAPGALLAGALFIVHPVHVESVAWIIERKDVLAGFFFFAALNAWLVWEEGGGRRFYALAFVLAACGMLAKSILVALPVALALLVWMRRPRRLGRALAPTLPFFLATGGIAAADWLFMKRVEAASVAWAGWDGSALERMLLAARASTFYAGKLLAPVGLTTVYPKWDVRAAWPAGWLALGGVLVVLGALWALRGRIGRAPAAAALFYLAALAPTLGILDFVFMRIAWVADRFQYLPSAAPLALAGAGGALAARRLRLRNVSARALALLALAPLAILTWRECGHYRDQGTLFARAVARHEASWFAHYNLAVHLLETGEREAGFAHLRRALSIRPDYPLAKRTLAQALVNRGAERAREGRPREAAADCRAALAADETLPEAWYNLGAALVDLGEASEAARAFGRAIELRPGFSDAHRGLGALLVAAGKERAGVDHLRRALQIDPNQPAAATELAWTLATSRDAALRDGAEAVRVAERALGFDGAAENPWLLDALAAAYAEAERYAEAVEAARRAEAAAREAGAEALAREAATHRSRFAAGEPWRQEAPASPTE